MKNKEFKRLLELSKDHKQITLHDNRFYQRNGEYYPSVTSILSIYPKGKYFEDWLKKVGYSSEYIVKKAGEEGTAVHNMIEDYLKGKEIKYLNDSNYPKYSPHVWKMFLNFVEFWNVYKPELIKLEDSLISDELKTAGTVDLVFRLDKKLWIVDHKTSNLISPTHEIQGSVYGKMFEEMYGEKVDEIGILWLKSTKRRFNKAKMQGKGWEMIRPVRTMEDNIEIFQNLRRIWDIENPNPKPHIIEFITSVKLGS